MRRTTAVLVWLLTLAAGAAAQDFPSRPVRLVVPFPPGGPLDLSGRLIGKEFQDRWGQPVVVENNPGTDREGQEGARRAQLRERGKRLGAASLRRAAEERGGHQSHPRALQRRGAGAAGGARGRAARHARRD